jgi:hypothetical protein
MAREGGFLPSTSAGGGNRREGRLSVSRDTLEPARGGWWRWWLAGAAVLLVLMLSPQLIEGAGSPCGALAVRQSILTAGNDPLGRALMVGAARAIGGPVIQAQIDAQGRSVMPGSVRCAFAYWWVRWHG